MSGLIVPVDVMAYCVGTLDANGPARRFSGGTTDFRNQTEQGQAFLGINVTRDFGQSPLWPLEAGVHLHWAMPDALTRAASDGGQMKFPALPNRWLVTRIVDNALGKKHWIITSDTLSSVAPGSNNAPTVPTMDTTQTRGFRYLGAQEVFDANWREPKPPASESLKDLTGYELHAVATGDIAFAAFYPNVRSVFGFHDDLADLTDVPAKLTYGVTGWYGTPVNDPLNGGRDLADLQTQFAWTFTSPAVQPPRYSLYSGLIQGIVWDPTRRYVDDQPKPIEADVAIGNHPAEALAAYFRKDYPAIKTVEELLTLFITGLLPNFATPAAGQLALLEEALHELQFAGLDGGTIYTVARGTDEVDDLPLALADELNLLNVMQQAADAAAVQVRQAKWQLFSSWYRLFLVDPTDTNAMNAAFTAFSAQFHLQAGIAQNWKAATDALATKKKAVGHMLSGGLTLTEVPAERYYTPNQPVVLLAGDAAAPARRYGGDGRYHPSGFLVCRLDTDVLQALSIGPATLKASQYSALTPPTPNQLPSPAIAALIEEAALLNTVIAAAVTGNAEATLAADLDAWLKRSEGPHLYGQPVGVPPSPVAVGTWPGENAWCSLMMLWEADFHPLLATANASGLVDYPADFFTANYSLDPDSPRAIAYQPGPGGISIDPATIDFDPDYPLQSGTQLYQGAAVLTATSADNLRNQLAKYLAHTPDSTLQKILDQLAVTDVAMQGLSGFHDALLTQQQALQLRIGVSPEAGLPFRSATQQLDSVVTSPGEVAPLAPTTNGFYSALRAGYMKLSLQVMDPFGCKRPVQIQNLYIADSLATSSTAPVSDVIYAQPRLAQPARLLWRWLAADSTEYDEMNSHPATTPVCGWLLPSHIEVGFFVYNAQGNPLGSLALRDDNSGIVWQAAPGDQATINAHLDTVMKHQNPHLRELALSLGKSTPKRFRAFWEAADRAYAQIAPAAPDSQSGLGVLVGRPLAVTQASLRLERQGFAALDQTFATLENGSFIDTDHALGSVEFPVVIGDLKRLDDGLVGYFKIASDGSYDTSTFYSEAAQGDDPGVVKPDPTNVLLTPTAASPTAPSASLPETKLLMLVDPRAPIHATMGILPTQALAIPADQYEDLLAGLELTFPITPVLRPAGGLAVPFPAIAGYNQSWITEEIVVDSTSTGAVDPQFQPPTAGAACLSSIWAVDPQLQSPTAGAVWQYSPQTLTEGWLRLNPELLQFRLANGDGAPVVKAGATESLTLTITNTRRASITFTHGTPGGESGAHSGSVFYIHFGSLVADSNVASIQLSAAGWEFLPLKDARYGLYWVATPTGTPVTLAPGKENALSMAMNNVVISKDTLALARVYFDYDDLTGCDDGIDEAVLSVAPPTSAGSDGGRRYSIMTTDSGDAAVKDPQLAFEIINNAGGKLTPNVIFISKDGNYNRVSLQIQLTSGSTTLSPGMIPDPMSPPTVGTTLYVDLHSLQMPPSVWDHLTVPTAGWTFKTFASQNVLGMTPTQSISLKAGDSGSISIDIGGIVVPEVLDAPIEPLSVDYYNVPNVAGETCFFQVAIQNALDGAKNLRNALEVRLSPKGIVNSVAPNLTAHNQFSLEFSSAQEVQVDAGPHTMFIVSFVYGQPGDKYGFGALTDVTNAIQINADPGSNADNWTITRKGSAQSPYWTLQPPAGAPIVGTGEQAVVEIKFSNVVTTYQPGPTVMLIQYLDVPGYEGGAFERVLDKVAHAVIHTLAVSPNPAPLSEDGTANVTVSWKTSDATALALAQDPGPTQDVTGMTQKSAVLTAEQTWFKLTATGAQGTVENVDYQNVQAIAVSQKPVICEFSGSIMTDPNGSLELHLKWTTKYSTDVSISSDPHPVNSSDQTTITPTPDKPLSYTYTLTARNEAGTTTSPPLTIGNWQSTANRQVGEFLADVAITPNGARIFTVDGNGEAAGHLSVFDAVTLEPVTGSPILVGTLPVSVSVSSNGARVAVADQNGTSVALFDAATLAPVRDLPVPGKGVSLTFSTDRLYVADLMGSLWVFDASSLTPVAGSPVSVGGIANDVAVSPNGSRVFVTTFTPENGFVIVLDSATLEPVAGSPIDLSVGVQNVAVSPNDSRVFITNGIDSTITVLDAASFQKVPGSPILVSGYSPNQWPYAIAFAPDGSTVFVSNHGDTTISVFDAATLQQMPGSPVQVGDIPAGMAVSPDGTRVFVATSPNVVMLMPTRVSGGVPAPAASVPEC